MKIYVGMIFTLVFLMGMMDCSNSSLVLSREQRSFFLLPPIFPLYTTRRRNRVPQEIECIGDSGLTGICSTKSDCVNNGGTSSGLCSDSTQVCCINVRSCGTLSKSNITYFVNPSYPDSYNGGSQCKITITKANSNICQVRIDFLDFKLMQPSNGICVNDFFNIGECIAKTICGDNKGQHVYINFDDTTDNIVLSIDTNVAERMSRTWNLKITQLGCNSGNKAPVGCLMYFTSTSGMVSSFNYGQLESTATSGNRIIKNLDYGICVETKRGYCKIEWSQESTAYSFTISNNANVPVQQLEARSGISCDNNFVVIANPFSNDIPLNVDRFCGTAFNRISSSAKPFLMRVVTGQNEKAMTEGTRGFNLYYRLLPCAEKS